MPEIVFREKDHTYWHGQRKIPNVTNIVKETLNPYRNMPDTPAHKEKLEYLGKLGKAVHAAVEYELLGSLDYETLKPPVEGFHKSFTRVRDSLNIRPICVEKIVYSLRLGFVGTMDLRALVTILAEDFFATIDWKTARSVWDHWRIQKALYLIGWYETFVEHKESLGVKIFEISGEKLWLPADPKKEKLICVLLREDGTFQMKEWKDEYPYESVAKAIDCLHKYHYNNGGWNG